MSERYIEYWGLARHPFLLAPDSKMMCVTGQYFECLERLKYAVDTNKGGVLVVWEDAGLGKTTMLLKLIDEMREEFGDAFRYAFVDNPALSPAQIIAQITGSIADTDPYDDKLKNLKLLKDALMDVKQHGGKSIIVVDEAQMLCEAHDVLQELRTLINLTHEGQYLHTFVLSGQRALWNTIKGMPEFWQRLPVRYYFLPLHIEETKEMIRFRLKKAGIDETRDFFADDALEIIHRYSRGSPRTVIALADLCLLVGYTNQSDKITFKEVSKAINTMSGKGDSLPFVRTDRKESEGPSFASLANIDRGAEIRRVYDGDSVGSRGAQALDRLLMAYGHLARPLAALVVIVAAILLGAMGFKYFFSPEQRLEKAGETRTSGTFGESQTEKSRSDGGPGETELLRREAPAVSDLPPITKEPLLPIQPPIVHERYETTKPGSAPVREAVINALAANVRTRPDIDAPRFAILFQGETVRILDETTNEWGKIWYKIPVLGQREGWIAAGLVTEKE